MSKRMRIAVIGARASGKSYLLYDMIHAFGLLGYHPEELPLSYPHRSFGAYFYDIFNNQTGGMRGTERYACRPENHYGAFLSKSLDTGNLFDSLIASAERDLEVDFLNIPGEVFTASGMEGAGRENAGTLRLKMFFDLLEMIQSKGKGIFYLSVWRNPSGHVLRLIVPGDIDFSRIQPVEASPQLRLGNYMDWQGVAHELQAGRYTETERKPINGKKMLNIFTELHTDSVLLTIQQYWNVITTGRELDMQDYVANQVLHYFYPLLYVLHATDIVICDSLQSDTGTGHLSEAVAHYLSGASDTVPNVYLAFRCCDLLFNKEVLQKRAGNVGRQSAEPSLRDTFYEDVVHATTEQLAGIAPRIPREELPAVLTEPLRHHILQSFGHDIGHAFWHLLNVSEDDSMAGRLRRRVAGTESIANQAAQWRPDHLPPHVYLTATPVDSHLRLYQQDPDDVTRFYREENGRILSFTRELCSGHAEHLCFGTYQLLADMLRPTSLLALTRKRHEDHPSPESNNENND